MTTIGGVQCGLFNEFVLSLYVKLLDKSAKALIIEWMTTVQLEEQWGVVGLVVFLLNQTITMGHFLILLKPR